MTVHRETCSGCGRTVYEYGRSRIIEAARTSSGRELAEEFLRDLEHSRRKKNTQRLADIEIVFESYARTGDLEIPRELNDLRDGVREIKPGDTRFPFYEISDEIHPTIVTRLTSGFFKKQEKTPAKEINTALWVKGEDSQS